MRKDFMSRNYLKHINPNLTLEIIEENITGFEDLLKKIEGDEIRSFLIEKIQELEEWRRFMAYDQEQEKGESRKRFFATQLEKNVQEILL